MARTCQVCGKGTRFGQNRSHSMRATKRTYKANIINKNIDLGDGVKIKAKICSGCYKKLVAQGEI